jgi:hypothetical protein
MFGPHARSLGSNNTLTGSRAPLGGALLRLKPSRIKPVLRPLLSATPGRWVWNNTLARAPLGGAGGFFYAVAFLGPHAPSFSLE